MSGTEEKASGLSEPQPGAEPVVNGGELKTPPTRPKLVAPPPRPTPSPSQPGPGSPSAATPLAAASASSLVATRETVTPPLAQYHNLPIAPPSEPMQYRAIGLVRGTYTPLDPTQLNRGNLVTADGATIDSVLLGRVTSLVKKYLDLDLPHLWVVYPRTRHETDDDLDPDLHLQIVGVWEPETLGLPGETPGVEADSPPTQPQPTPAPDLPTVQENFFSVRGEVMKYSPDSQAITVKILQGVKRSPGGPPKSFKLTLQGRIEGRTVGYFWDFHLQRQGKILMVQRASLVGIVPPKKRAKTGRRPGPNRRPGGDRPLRSTPGDRPVVKPRKAPPEADLQQSDESA